MLRILLLFFFFSSQGTQAQNVSKPFWFGKRQPPVTTSVKIVDFEMGINVKQVCGYSDWTTAQLVLPKKLLTKEYWKDIGKNLVDAAKRSALGLTGALPSMLACNVSPTFCHVLNQAELMASFENELTFDTCGMLENLENSKHLQATELKNCVKDWTDKGLDAGIAREKCLVGDTPVGEATKKKKIENTKKEKGGNEFKIEKFYSDLFPESYVDKNGQVVSLNSGGHAYSRRTKVKEFAKVLFPGVEFKSRSRFTSGGTFQPTVDDALASEYSELELAIISTLKEMNKLKKMGFGADDIISKIQDKMDDREKWKSEKKPHPFYRSTSDGSEPSLLITPTQLLMILPIVDFTSTKILSGDVKAIVDTLIHSVAHIKVTDMLGDLYVRALDVCKKSPDYEEIVAKKNCDLAIKRAKASLEIANVKRDAEQKARVVQAEVSSLIDGLRREKLNNVTDSRPNYNYDSVDNGRIKMPWEN